MYLPKARRPPCWWRTLDMHRNLCCRLDPQSFEQEMSPGDLAVQISCSHQRCYCKEIWIVVFSEILQILKVVCLRNKENVYKAVSEKYAPRCLFEISSWGFFFYFFKKASFIESPNGWDWKASLKVIWSNPSAQARWSRADCPVLGPNYFLVCPRMKSPRPCWVTCTRAQSPSQ